VSYYNEDDPIYLTVREHRIMGYLAQGIPRKQVSEMDGIDIKTVDYYIAALKKKFGANTPVQLGYNYAKFMRRR
jgi:DNA-binding CsgD family transcriptional regulator